MGTDIHMYIEQRVNNQWQLLAPPAPPPASERTETRKNHRTGEDYEYVSPFWGPHQCMYARDPAEYTEDKGYLYHWYNNRNYDVFAILTGTVRNGHGFAGVETSAGFRGIVPQPRGFPQDIAAETAKAYTGDHSEGWLTLREVLDFDWNQVTRHCGVIPMRMQDEKHPSKHTECFEEWRKHPAKPPRSHCGGISGPDVHTIDMVQAHRILDLPGQEREIDVAKTDLDLGAFATRGAWRHVITHSKPRYVPGAETPYWYVKVEWTETYRESAEDFLQFVTEFLVPLGPPEDIRLVFGFDS